MRNRVFAEVFIKVIITTIKRSAKCPIVDFIKQPRPVNERVSVGVWHAFLSIYMLGLT